MKQAHLTLSVLLLFTTLIACNLPMLNSEPGANLSLAVDEPTSTFASRPTFTLRPTFTVTPTHTPTPTPLAVTWNHIGLPSWGTENIRIF